MNLLRRIPVSRLGIGKNANISVVIILTISGIMVDVVAITIAISVLIVSLIRIRIWFRGIKIASIITGFSVIIVMIACFYRIRIVVRTIIAKMSLSLLK